MKVLRSLCKCFSLGFHDTWEFVNEAPYGDFRYVSKKVENVVIKKGDYHILWWQPSWEKCTKFDTNLLYWVRMGYIFISDLLNLRVMQLQDEVALKLWVSMVNTRYIIYFLRDLYNNYHPTKFWLVIPYLLTHIVSVLFGFMISHTWSAIYRFPYQVSVVVNPIPLMIIEFSQSDIGFLSFHS